MNSTGPKNPMLAAFNFFTPLSDKANEAFDKIIQFKVFPKHETLLEIGNIARYLYFFKKGAGRIYYLRDGLDVTDYFATDMQFLGGLESLMTKQPSNKGIETLEESELYFISYDKFEELCDQLHEVERLGRKMAIYGFLEGQRRVENIRFMSAAERYHELEKTHPGITNRVPLKYIASFLGTTQVSLSRIRSGIQ